MKIYRVNSIAVYKSGQHLIIQATGLASSSGWTNARLLSDEANPADKVLEFSFEADPPGGISLPVLFPMIASVTVEAGDAEAVLVRARTNDVTAHASEFHSLPLSRDRDAKALGQATATGQQALTTLMLGEEEPPTAVQAGEHVPFTTTGIFAGEEGHWPFPPLTTLRLGEETGPIGPLGTDIRLDDPAATFASSGLTTLMLGEEGRPSPIDPRLLGQGTPFGGF
jgi:hypothetical protein